MLEFFSCETRDFKSEYRNLQYIGGISWDEFIRLRFLWDACEKQGLHISFDEDAIFDTEEVMKLYQICYHLHCKANRDYYVNHVGKKPSMLLYSTNILKILTTAKNSKKFLYLVCD
jgi:hypothetical protein